MKTVTAKRNITYGEVFVSGYYRGDPKKVLIRKGTVLKVLGTNDIWVMVDSAALPIPDNSLFMSWEFFK